MPGPLQVATPTFTPVSGTYNGNQTISIGTSTSGAALFYTLDGSTPTSSSTPYVGPILLTSDRTIKAIGVLSGYLNSSVASATYVILPALGSTPYQVQGLTAEQSDGNILITWQASLGSVGYQIQRSTDGVNYTNLATVGASTQYVDVLPGIGIMYWYQVAGIATNIGPYSTAAQMVAALPSEMSLYELRLRSQQTADRVESDFVTTPEWNSILRLSMYELYDLLIGAYDENYDLQTVTVQTNGTTSLYPMPDGVTNYLGGTYPSTSGGSPSQAFYKLAGVDLNVNTSNVTPSRVTLLKFDFIKRNQYVYPNSTSTIYGIYNLRYRLMGNQLDLIPTPAGNQTLTMYYCPKLPSLLADTDLTSIGTSGWLRYVIVRAAKYALDKEEGSDTSKLDAELLFLKKRIEDMAVNRDIGQPDTISETRTDPVYGGNGFGGGGSNAGW